MWSSLGDIEITLEDWSYREFEGKCLLALQSELITVGTAEDPDDVSPLQRLNIGPAASITRKQDDVQLAAILAINRRTVGKAKGDIGKQMKGARSTRMKKDKLVTSLCDTNPNKLISEMVREDIGGEKSTAKLGVLASTTAASYSSPSPMDIAMQTEQFKSTA